MIVKENITINETNFVRHYSDAGVMIRKVGTDEEYAEAIDLLPCGYTYEETEDPIPTEENAEKGTEKEEYPNEMESMD